MDRGDATGRFSCYTAQGRPPWWRRHFLDASVLVSWKPGNFVCSSNDEGENAGLFFFLTSAKRKNNEEEGQIDGVVEELFVEI